MASFAMFLFNFLILSSSCCFALGQQVNGNPQNKTVLSLATKIGINYGRLGNNLPSPYQSINLIKSIKASHVKLYDADPETLMLLSQTKIYVTIMVPNDQITSLASDQAAADKWVAENVLPYYPKTRIRSVLVGNEILSYDTVQDKQTWTNLVPAMRKIVKALRSRGIHNIKVSTPLAMDALTTSFPPSNGTFRDDIAGPVMLPLLKFLNGTNSFLFLDVYPYFLWSKDPVNNNLDFALFQSNSTYTDPQTGLVYTNLLDQMLDSVIFAMTKLGYPNVRLAIAETGWPNSGDIDEIGANVLNAATYNRNLIKKMTVNPPLGTPARPGLLIPMFLFSLFNENRKPGPGTERHWGILSPDGTPVYEIDFSGTKPVSSFGSLPKPSNNVPFKGDVWCVSVEEASEEELGRALDVACGRSNATCAALAPGRECYAPVSVAWHASYAFSSHWSQFRNESSRCYFDGLARETTTDPVMIHLKVLRNDANGEEAFYGFSDSPSNLLLEASPLQVLPTLNSHKTLQRNHYTLRLPPAVTHLLRVTPPKKSQSVTVKPISHLLQSISDSNSSSIKYHWRFLKRLPNIKLLLSRPRTDHYQNLWDARSFCRSNALMGLEILLLKVKPDSVKQQETYDEDFAGDGDGDANLMAMARVTVYEKLCVPSSIGLGDGRWRM